MQTILVWLLISTGSHYSSSHVRVVERFKTEAACVHVQKNLTGNYHARCIQAEIIKP